MITFSQATIEAERFKFQHRHFMKRIRKFQRRVGPLIRRIERARATLQSISTGNP